MGGTQRVDECEWINEGDLDYNDGRWMTSCGNDFLLNEGSPTENKMSHCCYCGKVLKETIQRVDADADDKSDG
jgi:hypothetical protein